jgi:hypothetical protein
MFVGFPMIDGFWIQKPKYQRGAEKDHLGPPCSPDVFLTHRFSLTVLASPEAYKVFFPSARTFAHLAFAAAGSLLKNAFVRALPPKRDLAAKLKDVAKKKPVVTVH